MADLFCIACREFFDDGQLVCRCGKTQRLRTSGKERVFLLQITGSLRAIRAEDLHAVLDELERRERKRRYRRTREAKHVKQLRKWRAAHKERMSIRIRRHR